MKNFDDVVRTLADYVKSHQMSEIKTQAALDLVLSRLRGRGISSLCLDDKDCIQFRPDFKMEVEAILRGISQRSH